MNFFIGVLGPFVCSAGGQFFDRLPRKARALLAYLGTKLDQPVSREYLGDLLWPDRELNLGLHGVRNSLAAIRASLGEGSSRFIAGTVTSVRLTGASVDVDLLERCAATDDLNQLQEAANLYRGDFLLDVRIASEPFQDWVAIERTHAHDLAQGVFERLISAQHRGGQHEAAIRSAERLVTLDRLSERAHRLLMQAHAYANRRGDALRQYDRCAKLLWSELRVEPESETQELYAEIKRSSPDTRAHRSAQSTLLQIEPAAPRWPYLTPKLVVGLEPIRYLGEDAAQNVMAERLTEDLVADLFVNVDGVEFVRGTDPEGSLQSLVRAERREVDYILSASAQPASGDHLRLNVRLTEASTSAIRWVHRFECDIASLLNLQTELTREIAGDVQFALVVDSVRRSLASAHEIHALDECLTRATAALGDRSTPAATNEAQRWLLGALGIDLRNVDALATLARTCHHIASQPGWFDHATSRTALDIGRRAATRALEVAPGNAEAECFKGMLYSSSGELESASDAFDRAVEANCNLAIAHAFGGYNAAFLGHAEKTLPAIERAIRIGGEDRRQSVWWFFAGFAELLLARPERAVTFLGKSLDRNPDYSTAQLFLAAALRRSGKNDEAERMMALFKANFRGYERHAFSSQWLSRSRSPVYRAQILPVFEELRQLGLA
jgi:DNA-binding SARP family transcriptional activator